ncbi:MAG: YdcF family protein [Gammaproteobacteria bacterium]
MFVDLITRLVLLPPTNLIALLVVAYLARRRFPRASSVATVTGLVLLVALSTGAGSMLLVRPLENLSTPLAQPAQAGAQAIVVLGAGSIYRSPEYGDLDVPDEVALLRLRYGAHLQHATGLPLLVTGGNGTPDGKMQAKALGMARALREDFRTPVEWVEPESEDTDQNARFSARILHKAGVRRILLVTHAMHMPRSREAFERAGLEVVEAPTGFYSRGQQSALALVPSANGMYRSYYAAHEWIGLLWYRVRSAGKD